MLTYFESKVAEALEQSKPRPSSPEPDPVAWEWLITQWRADVSAIAYALDQERDAFTQSEFFAACGGL